MRETIKIYNWILTALLVLAIIGLGFIVNRLDPATSMVHLLLFYADLFVLVVCLGTLAAFYLRKNFGQREFVNQYFLVSFRQALWFGALIVASLVLQSQGVFSIINAILLVIALIFLESYFLYKPHNAKRSQ